MGPPPIPFDQAAPVTIPPLAPTVTAPTTDGLAARMIEMEQRLNQLQHENMLKEQETLRLRCRLADYHQLFESSDTLPKRARTDSDPSAESSFTKRSRAVFGSLFVTSNGLQYSLAPVKESFISVCEAPTLLFSGDWRAAQSLAKAEARKETHYLSVLADQHFFVPPILVKRIAAGGTMFAKPLGLVQSMDEFSRDWGLLHFAPASNKSERDRLSYQQGIEQADLLVDQHTYHLTKKDTKMVIQGSFDGSLDAILGTVANFIVFARTVVNVPEWGVSPNNPALINWLITLCDIIGTNPTSKQRLGDLCQRHNHLLHSIFSCFQDIFGAFGRIMLESDIIQSTSTILASNPVGFTLATSYTNLYLHPLEVFKRSSTRLSNLVNDQLLGDFIGPLGSYTIVHPPPPPPKQVSKPEDSAKPSSTQAGSRRGRPTFASSATSSANPPSTSSTGDWLFTTSADKFRDFKIPPGVPNFCMKFVFRGRTCVNPNCPYRHMGKDQLTPGEKQLLDNYISANTGKFQYAQ